MHSERIPPYAHRAGRSIPVALRRAAAQVAVLLALLSCVAAAPPRGAHAAGEPGGEPQRVWPLDLPERYLTSNFMEYRPGRFHAGLDFKTRSQEGFVVRAVEDGWISRVRATPGAYGRAIYLHGESGRTYVYAHLMRFNDAIRAELAPLRAESGRYRVRREFQPGQMPVRAGDVLGLSGQAGTLGPHLHFEVRDAAQRPLDPQAEGFAVTDTFPPVIHRLRALPASASARLGGGGEARVLLREDFGRDEADRLTLSGPVAFTARITEQADIRGHVLEPSRLVVQLDGRTVYESRNEGFAFDEVGLQRLEWLELPPEGERPALRERWLHRRAGDALPGRRGDEWYLGPRGEGLVPGEHELRVIAWDAAGNRDEVRCGLLVVDPTQACPPAGAAWRSEPIRACLGDTTCSENVCVRPLIEKELEGVAGIESRTFSPTAGDAVLAPVQVLFRWCPLSETQIAQAGRQGLTGSLRQLEVVAADWPLDGDLPFDLEGAGTGPVAGEVYTWDGREWDYSGGLLQPGAPGGPPRLGVGERRPHAVLVDRGAPRWPDPQPVLRFGPGAASPDPAVTLPRWEILPVALVDDGAGVDPATIEVELDGRRLIVEPDLLRDRILVELPDTCGAGPHELRARATDRAGNGSARTWQVVCEEP